LKSVTSDTPYFDPAISRIAVVGRPNVGKSTLFNRLLGARKAITDPTPGVTRDPVRCLWKLFGTSVVLLDTGGLTESKEFLDKHITKKSLEAAEAADVIVFVVDVDGLHPDDEDFIRKLRRAKGHIILVVNKVDNEQRAAQVNDFYRLGFEPVIGLSAAHGTGVPELLDAIADHLGITDRNGETGIVEPQRARSGRKDKKALKLKELEANDDSLDVYDDFDFEAEELKVAALDELPVVPNESRIPAKDPRGTWDLSVAILGQPNTGKSTLLNLLTQSELSLVSPVAGTTRDVIESSFRYKEKTFRILDTAGIRRKARVTEDLEYYAVNRAIASIEDADVIVLMVDAEKGLSEQDKKIAAQIIKHGRAVVMAVNKWDLLEDLPNQFTAVQDRMRYLFPVLSFAPIVALSATTGFGVSKLLDTLLELNRQIRTRTETGALNAKLKRWLEFTPPPTTKGSGRWKVRYITQVSAQPLHFVLFVNKVRGFPEAYIGYLTNQIRKECGIPLVPFKLTLRDGPPKGHKPSSKSV